MQIKIHTEYITLGQFLKFAGLIDTGGQAKDFLAANLISVNGEATAQRGKKIHAGDVIQVNEAVFKITR
ncbi:MAG: S4 domain-containing protein YaaA [Eubacteriales bacterium]|nr:S4 domain-containing protein YaaA [Eubacteriales bacterium]